MCYIFNFIFFLEIIINSFSGYYIEFQLVDDLEAIFKNYFKKPSGFFLDLVCQISVVALNITNEYKYQQIFFLYLFLDLFNVLKFNKYKLKFKQIEEILTQFETLADWFPLIKLIISMVITAHFLGLAFYFIAYVQLNWLDIQDNWLTVN